MTLSPEDSVTLTTRGKIAIITLNIEKKLNALTLDLYYRLSCLMREVAARDDVFITILTGKVRNSGALCAPFLFFFLSDSSWDPLLLRHVLQLDAHSGEQVLTPDSSTGPLLLCVQSTPFPCRSRIVNSV